MLVGARYVCPACALRGFVRVCPRCGGERLDLAEPRGLASFEEAWPLARAWRAGRVFVSAWSIRHDRRILGVAAAMSALVLIGAPLLAFLHDAPPLEALGAFAMTLVLAPCFFVLFALQAFYTAHLLRLVAYLYLGLGSVRPFFAFVGIVGIGLLRLAAWFLPRIELDETPAAATPLRTARLVAPLTVHQVVDGWGWMVRRDAWLACEVIELDGSRLGLKHESGAVSWAPSALSLLVDRSEHLAEGDDFAPSRHGGYRDAARRLEVPSWLHAPNRATRVCTTLVPAGRKIRMRGGVVRDGLLTSTPEHPVHLEII